MDAQDVPVDLDGIDRETQMGFAMAPWPPDTPGVPAGPVLVERVDDLPRHVPGRTVHVRLRRRTDMGDSIKPDARIDKQKLELRPCLGYSSGMKILGIDFTSRPSRRKPITCIHCTIRDDTLHVQSLEEWPDYERFEMELAKTGPWIAGIDFPFGQARRFIETIGWPTTWADYVGHARKLGRAGFREALNGYKENRTAGDKEHRRQTDMAAGSISPQKLYGVPVGLMFFEGAPRLLASGVTIPHLHDGDTQRIAVEAYPGVLARQFIGRRSYKNDARKKQTADQHEARRHLLQSLREEGPWRYGLEIDAPDDLCADPGADHLDALLCAVQAGWAWRQRDDRFGAPKTVDRLEGWIADPHLSASRPPNGHHPLPIDVVIDGTATISGKVGANG